MKKYLPYLLGFLILIAVFATVFVVAGIYDAGNKSIIEPYFMRRSQFAKDMPSQPKALKKIDKKRICDWLMQYYVKEYFSVFPGNTSQESNIKLMSSPAVFSHWQRDMFPKINDMLYDGARRTVVIFDEIFRPEENDYQRVEYELKTWIHPNDMSELPQTTHGVIYLKVLCDKEFKSADEPEKIIKQLREGENPAHIFNFQVLSVQE